MAAMQTRPPALPPHLRRGGRCSGDVPPVCRYWMSGRCNRSPCKFLHTDAPPPIAKKPNVWINRACVAKLHQKTDARRPPASRQPCREGDGEEAPPRSPPASACCGEERKEEPSGAWCVCEGLDGVAVVRGHGKAITGVALPEGSDKMYSSSLDGTVCVWDCYTGQCVHAMQMEEGDVGSLISMGPWVLAGVRGVVKALHMGSGKELWLRGPKGQVCSLHTKDDDEHLFAGTEDGSIYMWRVNQEQQCFDEVAVLTGHEKAVVSMVLGGMGLFAGSADGSIRVWDLQSAKCIYSFAGHESAITGLLCWDKVLLSSSCDGTVKVWQWKPDHEEIELEVCYTHREDAGVAAIFGTKDAEKKSMLFVCCSDGSVRVYDLSSMRERGRIHSRDEVGTMSIGPGGLMFTGDRSGEIRVVRLRSKAEAKV